MIPTQLGYRHLYAIPLRVLSMLSDVTNLLAVVPNIGNILNWVGSLRFFFGSFVSMRYRCRDVLCPFRNC